MKAGRRGRRLFPITQLVCNSVYRGHSSHNSARLQLDAQDFIRTGGAVESQPTTFALSRQSWTISALYRQNLIGMSSEYVLTWRGGEADGSARESEEGLHTGVRTLDSSNMIVLNVLQNSHLHERQARLSAARTAASVDQCRICHKWFARGLLAEVTVQNFPVRRSIV